MRCGLQCPYAEENSELGFLPRCLRCDFFVAGPLRQPLVGLGGVAAVLIIRAAAYEVDAFASLEAIVRPAVFLGSACGIFRVTISSLATLQPR